MLHNLAIDLNDNGDDFNPVEEEQLENDEQSEFFEEDNERRDIINNFFHSI